MKKLLLAAVLLGFIPLRASATSPYKAPVAIPGTIEAEDFDTSDYRDTTRKNLGGAYRPNQPVDIQGAGSSFWLAYMNPGEYTSYTFYVRESGTYNISAVTSTFRDNASLAAIFRPLKGPYQANVRRGPDTVLQLRVPNTGGWFSFARTPSSSIQLVEGYYVVKIVTDKGRFRSGDYILNLDSVIIEGAAPAPQPTPVPPFSSAITNANCSPIRSDRAYQAKACRALTYASDAQGRALKLDLYLPNEYSAQTPVITYFAGGGWVSGSRSFCDPDLNYSYHQELMDIVNKYRFALACVSTHIGYWPGWTEEALAHQRTEDEKALALAGFRAQIADAKAAVRWLRSNWPRLNGKDWRLKPIGSIGDSAGGTVAVDLALTAGLRPDLLEYAGQDLTVPSSVQAAASLWGGMDLDTSRWPNALIDVWLNPHREDRPLADPTLLVRSRPAGMAKIVLVQGLSDQAVQKFHAENFKAAYEAKLRAEAPALYAQRGNYIALKEFYGGHGDWRGLGQNLQFVAGFLGQELTRY